MRHRATVVTPANRLVFLDLSDGADWELLVAGFNRNYSHHHFVRNDAVDQKNLRGAPPR
jgi:hypothetical protein